MLIALILVLRCSLVLRGVLDFLCGVWRAVSRMLRAAPRRRKRCLESNSEEGARRTKQVRIPANICAWVRSDDNQSLLDCRVISKKNKAAGTHFFTAIHDRTNQFYNNKQ